MTTRFDAQDKNNYGVSGVKSGFDGEVKSDFSIPSCGIEDVDMALFHLFDKEIELMIDGQDSATLKKVPVIFAAGEKWALLKNKKPLRDKTNTLILPLVTIMRSGISQNFPEDIVGRGINQQTGEIIIRRRLDKQVDRNYQNLINRFLIPNQENVAVTDSTRVLTNQPTTDRDIGQLAQEDFVRSGALLVSNKTNNVFETIVIPSPQFYTATYEVTVWAQYTQHMNQIIEKLMSSFLPQAQSWKLITPKGYWFIASVDGGNFNIETNFDDMSTSERYIKCNITLKVPAYVWASSAPGVPVPVKRYVSSPTVDFSTTVIDEKTPEEYQNNTILGSDDPTLPLDDQGNSKSDQRRPGWNSRVVQPSNSIEKVDSNDPALASLPRGLKAGVYRKIKLGNEVKYVKIITVNPSTGETVYSPTDLV
jgi:hypothetical protein